MITEFEKIPGSFVELYRYQFEYWARHFRQRGPLQLIELRPVPHVMKMNPDPAQGPVREFVTLRAERKSQRMLIVPHTDEDADKIARHMRAMRAFVLQ